MRKRTLWALMAAVFLAASVIAAIPAQAQPPPSITAQAAIVMCYHTGDILFERDAHTPRVPASMTKSMTAFVIYEEIEAGNLTLDTMITVSANAARVSADTNMQGAPLPIAAGTQISVDTMLHLIMLPSSNGACVAMAEHISGSEEAFAQRMNESAAAIGMFSEFTNAHGAIAHYTNAYSMALLLRTFIQRYPDILRVTSARYVYFNGVRRNNTNLLFTTFPSYGADGFRTGTTREAGFCLAATAYRDGRRIITVVMNAPDNPGRYGDTQRLLDFGFAEVARRVRVELEGELIQLATPPQMIGREPMLPIRDIFLALDPYATFVWDGTAMTATVSMSNGDVASLTIGSTTAYLNGVELILHTPPAIINHRTFVSRCVIVGIAGRPVGWFALTQTVSIYPAD